MQLNDQKPDADQSDQVLADVREVLQLEADAVRGLVKLVDEQVFQAVNLLQRCRGRIIVTGMGKMGWIAHKAAATLSSTGSPAIYLHPGEAAHGDLGIVTPNDVLIALSNSGETDELNALLPFMHRWNVPVIAITGNLSSTLATRASIALNCFIEAEADADCPAPTCSTTAALAMCDAIAVALMRLRGFKGDQFAVFHPGGLLGRQLLTTVADVMRVETGIPFVAPNTSLKQAIVEMSSKSLGCVLIVDDKQHLLGILTDGDLRRTFQATDNPLENMTKDLMSQHPSTIDKKQLAADALRIMEQKSITVLPVVEAEQQVIGIVHLHDLMRAGLG